VDQAVLAVAVEDKVADASRGVKKSNVRMKSLLGQVRGAKSVEREGGGFWSFFSFSSLDFLPHLSSSLKKKQNSSAPRATSASTPRSS
jgi:hypothetical protein